MVKYKESESESESASQASEPRFRVRVCMQRFYSDERARAYVCVTPRRRVRWLQRRLRRLFALPPHRLLSRGHLLPPQEPLALLQPDDPVEVIPADTKPDDVAACRGVVGSVDEAAVTTAEAPQRSPAPVHSDDLTETKRQALLMLDQFCTWPATDCAVDGAVESAPRPRRRRVRRRRRVPAGAGDDSVDVPGDVSGDVSGDVPGDVPDDVPADELVDMAGDGLGVGPCGDTEEGRGEGPGDGRGEGPRGEAPLVLRNELKPRAPRVVRPLPRVVLPDRTIASTDIVMC